MPIQIILINLGLAIGFFLCGLVVGGIAWFTHVYVPPGENAARRKWQFRIWGALISLLLFAVGLYDLQQLVAQRVVPWAPALIQVTVLGFFALCAVLLFLADRRHSRIRSLLENEQTDEAIELLQHWIKIARSPKADLHSMLGMIYLNSDRSELAVAELRRAVEISQGQPMYLSHLAIALNNLGETDEALQLIVRAAETDPTNRWLYTHNRCWFLAKAGRVDEARQLLPEVEQYHQQMMSRMPPLDQRRIAETLSEMQDLCDRPPGETLES